MSNAESATPRMLNGTDCFHGSIFGGGVTFFPQ